MNDETRLIRAIKVGSPEMACAAFEQLYEANDSQLRAYLARYKGLQEAEIDEVCAKVWFRSFERIGEYKPTGVPYFVWLKRTADNIIHEIEDKKFKDIRHTMPIDDEFDIEDASNWGQDPLLRLIDAEEREAAVGTRKEIQEAVRSAIEDLSTEDKEVLQAREDLGFSASDTADLLGWKVEKVYDRYYRSKNRVKDILLKRYGGERVATWVGKRSSDLGRNGYSEKAPAHRSSKRGRPHGAAREQE